MSRSAFIRPTSGSSKFRPTPTHHAYYLVLRSAGSFHPNRFPNTYPPHPMYPKPLEAARCDVNMFRERTDAGQRRQISRCELCAVNLNVFLLGSAPTPGFPGRPSWEAI
eukprot:1638943-Prymnesium_polylepis.1